MNNISSDVYRSNQKSLNLSKSNYISLQNPIISVSDCPSAQINELDIDQFIEIIKIIYQSKDFSIINIYNR